MKNLIMSSLLVFAVVFAHPCPAAAGPAIDPAASYMGPFDGASNFEEIAQEFVVSATGYLSALAVYVPTMWNMEGSFEFGWELRDASIFDYEIVNIDDLPVLYSGTALSDYSSPDDPFACEPVMLVSDLGLSVAQGQRFLMLVRIINTNSFTAMWIGGSGNQPGEAFMRKGTPVPGPWVHVPDNEFGRTVWLEVAVESQQQTWGGVKILYR